MVSMETQTTFSSYQLRATIFILMEIMLKLLLEQTGVKRKVLIELNIYYIFYIKMYAEIKFVKGTLCGTNGECVNYAKFGRCECAAGYTGDGFSCSDLNECLTGKSECDPHAECQNTIGR